MVFVQHFYSCFIMDSLFLTEFILMFGFIQLPQPTTPFMPFTYLVTILSNMFLVL